MYGETVHTAPATGAVSLATLKEHLRIEHWQEDVDLQLKLDMAIEHVQNQCNRQFITATREFTFDRFPVGREPQLLPRAPLQGVSQITYVDAAGDSQTINSATIASEYVVVTATEPGKVAPKYGYTWPITRGQPGDVVYRVTCGYGSATTDVPREAVAAILLMAGHLVEFREDTIAGPMVRSIPRGVQSLLESLAYDDLVDYRPKMLDPSETWRQRI